MHRRSSGFMVGAVAVALLLGLGTNAHAASITGNITFGGEFAPTGGTDLSDATGIDITDDEAVVVCAILDSCGGAYSSLTGMILATYNDFTFAPLGGNTSPLWTFDFNGDTYSFDLQSVNIISQTAVGIVLNGSGLLHITGFDSTPGSWSFSGDQSGATFAFSATNVATPAPEPASLALFGIALLGGAGALRRRRRV